MKKILFIMDSSPYSSSICEEMLDTILFAASFGQEVSVLFKGHGVWQLVKSPGNESELFKNITKMISAFPTFDISHVYVRQKDLDVCHLTTDQLVLNPLILKKHGDREFLLQFDLIMGDIC